MKARIEIYNDNGDFVGKYEAPPYEELIDYCDGYMIHKYDFRFMYTELQEARINDKTCKNH